MQFEAHGGLFTHDRQSRFVGMLVHVERIDGRDVSVPGDQMHRIFHIDPGKLPVARIAEHGRDRPGTPFGHVEQMRDGILNGAASCFMPGEVRVGISGPIQGKSLPRYAADLQRRSPASGLHAFTQTAHQRMGSQLITHRRRQPPACNQILQFIHVVQRRGQGLFDDQVTAASGRFQSDRDMGMGRRGHQNGIPGILQSVLRRRVRIRHAVCLLHAVSGRIIRFADAQRDPAGGPITAYVTFPDRPTADDQYSVLLLTH